MDDLKCGICLELFQDPRSLPCLHTFCRECIQCSLKEENHSLKCPVCRAKHELSEGAGVLPVNQYALQELPLKRLLQQREDNGGQHQLVECKSCGELAVMVAWCYECDAMICPLCEASHKKFAFFREHHVVKKPTEGKTIEVDPRASSAIMAIPKCLLHIDQNLKHFCVPCSELVCSDCLLAGSHTGHEHRLVEEARHSLQTEMKELESLVKEKNEEFSNYLEKVNEAESKALEYSELMKSEVNNVFDGIVASVEAQRNEALQSVSQGVKEIWSQKEIMEVSLAQLDSFTRFADHTHKCTTDASFVSMATQCVKLMSQIKNVKGDKTALKRNMVAILPLCGNEEDSPLHVDLDELFILGRPSLSFMPSPETGIVNGCQEFISVSLMVGGEIIISEYLRENCSLNVSMYWSTKPVEEIDDEPNNDDDEKDDKESDKEPILTTRNDSNTECTNEFELDESIIDDTISDLVAVKILPSSSEGGIECFKEDAVEIECSTKLVDGSNELEWVIDADFCCLQKDCQSLVVRCKLSGAISSETVQVRMELHRLVVSSSSSDDDDL